MKRKIILFFVLIGTLGLCNSLSASYTDSANKLASDGVIVDNSSNPDEYRFYHNITRGEMAKITMNLSKENVGQNCSGIFADLNSSNWACKYAEAGNRKGYFARNQYFRPNDNVTKIEALKMIMQAKGIEKSSKSDWREAYVESAYKNKLIDSYFYDYNTQATRGWIFDIAVRNAESDNNNIVVIGDNDELNIVSSIDDDISENSMWCGTFQIVWNDMVNNLVKGDVVFTPQTKEAINLNKQTFTSKELSSNSYYSDFGKKSLELKNRIEKNIKEKFNETSDVLNIVDWSNAPEKDDTFGSEGEYIFYAMLKKVFKYKNPFDKLENGDFDNGKYKDIKYFGIKYDSYDLLSEQVNVLYYNSDEDFAVSIDTKEGENVILVLGTSENSFYETYNTVLQKSDNYEGIKYFRNYDYIKVPNIKIDILKSFENLKNKKFPIGDLLTGEIAEAVQTIKLELDESGGELKSEALILLKTTSSAIEPEKRYFYFDRPFTLFLKEQDKDLPYFAAQISDITLFQK